MFKLMYLSKSWAVEFTWKVFLRDMWANVKLSGKQIESEFDLSYEKELTKAEFFSLSLWGLQLQWRVWHNPSPSFKLGVRYLRCGVQSGFLMSHSSKLNFLMG